MGDEAHKKEAAESIWKRDLGIGPLVWLVIISVIYPLSIGPVAKFVDYDALPSQVMVFYFPIMILDHFIPPVHRALVWYLRDIWGVPIGIR